MRAPAPRVEPPPSGSLVTRVPTIELRAPSAGPVRSDPPLVFLTRVLALEIDARAFQASPLEALKRAAELSRRPTWLGAVSAIPDWERLIQTSVKIIALSKDFEKLPKALRESVIVLARPLRSKGKAAPLLAVEGEIEAAGLHGVKAQSFLEALGEAGRIVWIGD